MKSRRLYSGIAGATLAGAFFMAFQTSAQDEAARRKAPTPEQIAKATQPGPEHEALASLAGHWDLSIKMGGGGNAMTYAGGATNRMTTGGRFLFIECASQGKAGQATGTFTIGFDPRHEHFQLMATDSFGNYFVTSQGRKDPSTGLIKMSGQDDDPMMKAMGLKKEFLHVLDVKGPDEFVIEVWFIDTRTAERNEIKFMEHSFSRKKGSN